MLQRAGIPGFDPPNSTQDTKFQFWLHFKYLGFLTNNSYSKLDRQISTVPKSYFKLLM